MATTLGNAVRKGAHTVKSLVELRMNTQGPMKRQSLTLKLSNSSGLKESEAVKIDAY